MSIQAGKWNGKRGTPQSHCLSLYHAFNDSLQMGLQKKMATIGPSENSVEFSEKPEKYKGLEVQKLQSQCLGMYPAASPSPSVSYEQIQVMSRWQQLQMHKTTLSHPLPSLFVFVTCKQFEGAFQKHTVEKSHIHRCLCSFCLHHLIRLAICHSTTCIYKTTRK